jgi:UDP-N-acetyl-D-glucosamine dehydrogenase
MHLLQRRGARISYSDPYVPSVRLDGFSLESDDSAVSTADCIVVITDHKAVDYAPIVKNAKLILDTRNALKQFDSPNIVRL